MRKLFYIAALALHTIFANGQNCKIEIGKIAETHVGNRYKLFHAGELKNTCFPVPDSASLWIGVLCETTNEYQGTRLAVNDTLVYEINGKVSVAASVYWWKNGNSYARTDFFENKVPHITEPSGSECFTKIGTITQTPVDTTTPPTQPPVFVPEIGIQNGAIVSNTGGTLILSDYPNFIGLIAKDYSGAFDYALPAGWWYYYLILPDGSTIGNEVVLIP